MFRTILARGGYTVFEVVRGSEAVAKAREVRPHIIVLDVNLPDLDGLEVCRASAPIAQTASIPVLMLTVRHDDTDVLAGLEAGADDYVAKDSAPELILARVQRLVQLPPARRPGDAQPAARAGRPAAGGDHPRDPRARSR